MVTGIHPDRTALCVNRVVTGPWRENCWVLAGTADEALVIDPGDEAGKIVALLAAKHLRPLAVLVTHGHHDHVGAAAELCARFDVPFLMHPAEKRTLASANFFRVTFDKRSPIELPTLERWLPAEEADIEIGSLRVHVVPTPGHTPGGVSFIFNAPNGEPDLVFCGDTLVGGNVGRADLPGGCRETLTASLRRLAKFDPSSLLFPGHGDATDLATELETNKSFREALA